MEDAIIKYRQTAHFQEHYNLVQLITHPGPAQPSEIVEVIKQRADTLSSTRFHWFVRLQSLIFVTEALDKQYRANPQEDLSQACEMLIPHLQFMANEKRQNNLQYLAKLVDIFSQTAPQQMFAHQAFFVQFLMENLSADHAMMALNNIFANAILSPQTLTFLKMQLFNSTTLDRNVKQTMMNNILSQLMSSEQFSFILDVLPDLDQSIMETGQFVQAILQKVRALTPVEKEDPQLMQNFVPESYSVPQAAFQMQNAFQHQVETMHDQQLDLKDLTNMLHSRTQNFADNGQTIMLLQQAENLIQTQGDAPRQYDNTQQHPAPASHELVAENERLKRQILEYQLTIQQMSENDQPADQTVQQLQLELAQTKNCFDQLMVKYTASRDREKQLIAKIQQSNNQILQFKSLFDEANKRYETVKRSVQMIKYEGGGSGNYKQQLEEAQKEIEKLRYEKQQFSDITKKLIAKINQGQK